ncbi:MAG TPA: OmpA family protein, partial [Terriglobales bacterium]|nr:OmpA family protein [Terriglobales bacterium]
AANVQQPTYSDVYCAGFITKQAVPTSAYVAGGWGSPHETYFSGREYIYLTGGGFQEGAEYTILRHVHDPNNFEAFKGQHSAVASVGEPYAELARVKIVQVEGNTGIAWVSYACDNVSPGDIAVPFVEKAVPNFAEVPFNRFAPPNGKLTGRIVMARDFDYLVGTRARVYLDVGADKGVKVGDYFTITRTYEAVRTSPVDYLSYKASLTSDIQKDEPTFPASKTKELPRMALGQMIIVGVTPTSATGLITFALEAVEVGDQVEMAEIPPPPPPPPPPPMNPPTITCVASPATVHPGENSTITCQGTSPDDRTLAYTFAADRGQLAPRDNSAVLGTQELTPGAVTVTSTATDDRSLSASAINTINVEAAPAPPAAAKLADINFKRGSAYVDNKAKAILDDIALRLQREADSTAVVVGFSDPKEAKSLAAKRANNVKTYLTRSKGIDPKRIETRTGTNGGGMKAEVWIVPAGASMP